MPPFRRAKPAARARRFAKRAPRAMSARLASTSRFVRTVGSKATVSKCYNVIAARPHQPMVSIEQGIQVQVSASIPSFATSGAATSFYAMAFALNTQAATTAYIGVFDQYRIDQIEVWVEPFAQSAQDTQGSECATCVDINDSVVPTTFSSVADHQGGLVSLGGAAHYHAYKPHVTIGAASTAIVLDGLVNNTSPWLSTATPGTPHNGFKMAVTATPATFNAVTFNLAYRLTISFRGPTTG